MKTPWRRVVTEDGPRDARATFAGILVVVVAVVGRRLDVSAKPLEISGEPGGQWA
jgi:hypothetical protein